MTAKHIVVIGGGPAGYTAAIHAAQLGAQVTLVERDQLGGTCLNRGCIPTKTLLQSADLLREARRAAEFGVNVTGVSLDYPAAMRRKERVVKQLVGGLGSLMRKNKVKVVQGTGDLTDRGKALIQETGEVVSADGILIATGSRPKTVPIEGVNAAGVVGSGEALSMQELPQSAIIIGAGAIGLEFAQMWGRMGVSVTVLEMMDQIMPGEDKELAQLMRTYLEEEGITVHTGVMVNSISNSGKEISVSLTSDNQQMGISGACVLLAAGREPDVGGLSLAGMGIAVENGAIQVTDMMETSVPGVCAAGDAIGGWMLAHVAMAEAKCAVRTLMGAGTPINRGAVPRCVYGMPELAAVGLTEEQAAIEYGKVKIGRFPFKANGRALAMGQASGMVKIVSEARHGEILGVHILGPAASELIAEATLAMQLEATHEDLASVIHAHPTLSEASMEAALGVEGLSIHV